MFIMTVNMIVPELETVVKVTNSLYSTVIQYLLRIGYRGESLRLLLRYDMIVLILLIGGGGGGVPSVKVHAATAPKDFPVDNLRDPA